MLKNFKKFFLSGAALLIGASALAGCSSAMTKASETLNPEVVAAMNRSAVVQQVTDAEFEDFSFYAADFNRADGNKYDIDVCGVAKDTEGQNSYVTLSYNVSDSHFAGLKQDDKVEVINAIKEMVAQEEIEEFDLVPVSSVNALNKTLKKTAERVNDDYYFTKGMVFSLSNVQINEENGTASFRLRSHNKYEKTEQRYEPGMVYDMQEGSYKPGMVWRTYYYSDDYIHTNDIYIKASAEDLQLMKLDHSYIIDHYVNYVNNGQKDNYVINSVSTDKVSDYDVSMISDVEIENI